MARPGSRKQKVSAQAEGLSKALAFVASVGERSDEFWQEFVRLQSRQAVSFNGVVGAGHPIEEELTVSPKLKLLQKALVKAGAKLTISELANGTLSIKGEKLDAKVPCVPAADLPPIYPDANLGYPIDGDRIREAFRVCGALVTEAADEAFMAAVLLEGNQCTATDRKTIMQYWHGVNLPPGMVLPKLFVSAVLANDLPIVGFGFGQRPTADGSFAVGSLTFWFEGGAWIKTVCYADPYPTFAHLFDAPNSPKEVPAGFFEAVETVASFNEYGFVTLAHEKVQSHSSDQVGASWSVKGMPGGKQITAKGLLKISGFIKAMDFTSAPDRLFFSGDGPMRGITMCVVENSHSKQAHQDVGRDQYPAEMEGEDD